ncbi:MAG: hypothetical protein Q4B73_01295 [Lachnospiraceae bacterium]|nr:hypothetical protein [Lachnospiraceae bacterium]
MEKKKQKKPYFLIVMWSIIALLAVSGITYAWFNFSSSTNVTPDTGSTISNGEASLLISTSQGGPFDKTVNLVLGSHSEALRPVSTYDLNGFYTSAAQNANGITILYQDVTNEVDAHTMRGTLYLKAEGGDLDVYFMKPMLDFGSNVQALASLRLGLKITGSANDGSYIFRLDDMMDVSGAASRETITNPGSTVSSISGGSPNYVSDPARNINEFCAQVNSPEDTDPQAGPNALMTLTDGQIAEVNYRLYLEGCDNNCINEVQVKEVALSLGFAGVPRG